MSTTLTDNEIAKRIMYMLRHGAIRESVPMDREGYVLYADLVQWCQKKGWIREPVELERILADSQSKYGYRYGPKRIRATTGHSLEVDVTMERIDNPTQYLVCAKRDHEGIIRARGLVADREGYVTMLYIAPESWSLVPYGKGQLSTSAGGCLYVIVNGDDAGRAGVEFYATTDGVVRAAGSISPEYLEFIPPYETHPSGNYGLIVLSDAAETQSTTVLTVTNPAGYIDFVKTVTNKGEHPLACAIRALTEKTGLLIGQLRLRSGVLSEANDKGAIATNYYVAETILPEPPVEGDGWNWIPMNILLAASERTLIRRRRELLERVR